MSSSSRSTRRSSSSNSNSSSRSSSISSNSSSSSSSSGSRSTSLSRNRNNSRNSSSSSSSGSGISSCRWSILKQRVNNSHGILKGFGTVSFLCSLRFWQRRQETFSELKVVHILTSSADLFSEMIRSHFGSGSHDGSGCLRKRQ